MLSAKIVETTKSTQSCFDRQVFLTAHHFFKWLICSGHTSQSAIHLRRASFCIAP